MTLNLKSVANVPYVGIVRLAIGPSKTRLKNMTTHNYDTCVAAGKNVYISTEKYVLTRGKGPMDTTTNIM